MLKKLCQHNVGEEIDLVLLIKNTQCLLNKKKQPYLLFNFSDSSGSLVGFYWDANSADQQRWPAGKLAEVNGLIEQYHGQKQVKIYSLRLVGPEEGYNLSDFLQAAPLAAAEMQNQIDSFVQQIKQQQWQEVVRFLLQKWHERFYTFPAGRRNHHAVKGGLAFHTLTMLQVSQSLCRIYPQINSSLLYAGCILHDLGKVIELSGPGATEYTTAGNLLGHLVLVDEQIALAAEKLGFDLQAEPLVLLRHLVIAHNGQLAYGSPKEPVLLEAEVLHWVDDLDAGLNAITASLEQTQPGKFSLPLMSRAGKRYYRPSWKKE